MKDSKIAHPSSSSLCGILWDHRSFAGQRDLLRTPHILVSFAARDGDESSENIIRLGLSPTIKSVVEKSF